MFIQHNLSAKEHFNKIILFRQAAYACLGSTRDALFKLSDVVIGIPTLQSFAKPSYSRYFRRSWPSLFEARQDERPDREQSMRLYSQNIPQDARPMLACDHTAWPRPTENRTRPPGRVYQGMNNILTRIGTPAKPPKRRGNALGWPKEHARKRRPRFDVVKNAKKRPKSAQATT
jgi:hypothetical protein